MAHRIGGRKLSRKQGPRIALYKNLTVSILRYERVQTTEAKAKEIRGRVEKMITLAKQGDLTGAQSVASLISADEQRDRVLSAITRGTQPPSSN